MSKNTELNNTDKAPAVEVKDTAKKGKTPVVEVKDTAKKDTAKKGKTPAKETTLVAVSSKAEAKLLGKAVVLFNELKDASGEFYIEKEAELKELLATFSDEMMVSYKSATSALTNFGHVSFYVGRALAFDLVIGNITGVSAETLNLVNDTIGIGEDIVRITADKVFTLTHFTKTSVSVLGVTFEEMTKASERIARGEDANFNWDLLKGSGEEMLNAGGEVLKSAVSTVGEVFGLGANALSSFGKALQTIGTHNANAMDNIQNGGKHVKKTLTPKKVVG